MGVLSLAGSTKRCENDISGSQGPRSIQSPSKNVKITLGEAVDAGGDGNGNGGMKQSGWEGFPAGSIDNGPRSERKGFNQAAKWTMDCKHGHVN